MCSPRGFGGATRPQLTLSNNYYAIIGHAQAVEITFFPAKKFSGNPQVFYRRKMKLWAKIKPTSL